MSGKNAELLITVSMDGGDEEELDELTRQLRSEIEGLNVDSVENVSLGKAPSGTKAADWVTIGQMVVTLAPTVIAPLFTCVKSWVERKPSTPVKIRIKLGRKTAQIEYDPVHTTEAELATLVKAMGKSMK
jgi:hypothetical protein